MSTIHAAQEQRGAMSLKSWAMLILLGAIWGGSFFFARVAVAEIHPLTLVLFRVAIAAIALNLYLAARGPSIRLALPYAGGFFLLALLNNVIPFSLIFAGQTQLGAGLASVLNATTPFWTALLANMLTADEKLSWNKVAGILLGLAGTAVMIGPGLFAGLGGPVWPKLALIGASLSYAFALMVAKRLKGVPPTIVAAAQLTASTIIMVPVVLVVNGVDNLFAASAHVWGAVARAGADLDRLCIYSLFQPDRKSRRHQRLAGHADRAGQRNPSRRDFSWRKAGADRGGRHGGNRRWTDHFRRQGLWQRYHDAWMTNSATISNKPIFEIFSTGKDGSRKRIFLDFAAMQHAFRLYAGQTVLDSLPYSTHGGIVWD